MRKIKTTIANWIWNTIFFFFVCWATIGLAIAAVILVIPISALLGIVSVEDKYHFHGDTLFGMAHSKRNGWV